MIIPRPKFRTFKAQDRPDKYLQSDTSLKNNIVTGLFKGINVFSPAMAIEDNELTFSRNGYSKGGVFRKCPGLVQWGIGQPLNGRIWGLIDFKLIDDSSTKLAITEDDLYYHKTVDDTWTKIGSSAIFTGAATDRVDWSVVYSETAGNYILIMTNYKDAIQYYDGTSVASLITAFKARFTRNFENVQFYGDIYESPNRYGQRIYWSDIGKPGVITGGLSGGVNLVKSQKFLQGFQVLRGALLTFKDNTISIIRYTGSYNFPFTVDENALDVGTRSIATAIPIGDEMLFLGSDRNVYLTDGALRKDVSQSVRKVLGDRIDINNMSKNFAALMNDNKWYVLSVVTDPGEPNECWVLDLDDWTWQPFQAWNKITSGQNFTKGGITIGELTGKIYTYNFPISNFQQMSTIPLLGDSDGYIYKYGSEVLNNDGVAIEQLCETKDFIWDERLMKRISEVIVELVGRGSVDFWYSVDEGVNWIYLSTKTITDAWKEYIFKPNKTCQFIRFRFKQNAVDEYYSIRSFNPRRIDKGLVKDAT